MSHHGHNPLPGSEPADEAATQRQLSDAMRRLLGEFPDGKLNVDDAGAVAMAVGVENGLVVLRFPKPVAWVGMTGDEAFELAQCLLRHARNAGVTAPLIIRVGG